MVAEVLLLDIVHRMTGIDRMKAVADHSELYDDDILRKLHLDFVVLVVSTT